MNRILILFAVFCIVFIRAGTVGAVALSCSLSDSAIKAEIQHEGAKSTIGLEYRAGHWDELMRCAATGNSTWIKIATSLREAADGTAAENLDIAIAEALGNRPGNVLKLAQPVFDLHAICAAPNRDDSRFDSYVLAMKEIERRQHALDRVTDKHMHNDVVSCRGYLEDAKKWVAHTYQVKPIINSPAAVSSNKG